MSQAGRAFPGGWWAAVALAALLATIIAVVLSRTGPLARSRRAEGQLMTGSGPLSAADHRLRAGRLADAGDYAGATVERVRAIARELDDRAVLTPRAGRTANEMADEAAAALPAEAGALRSAALLFDDICYGDRPGTAARIRAGPASWTRGSARRSPSPAPALAGAGPGRAAAGPARARAPGRARAERDDRTGAHPG